MMHPLKYIYFILCNKRYVHILESTNSGHIDTIHRHLSSSSFSPFLDFKVTLMLGLRNHGKYLQGVCWHKILRVFDHKHLSLKAFSLLLLSFFLFPSQKPTVFESTWNRGKFQRRSRNLRVNYQPSYQACKWIEVVEQRAKRREGERERERKSCQVIPLPFAREIKGSVPNAIKRATLVLPSSHFLVSLNNCELGKEDVDHGIITTPLLVKNIGNE